MEDEAGKTIEENVSNMDSVYLIYHVGTPLAKALAEIVQKQPSDPIQYLSCWLYKYKDYQFELKKEKENVQLIMEAEMGKMKKMACIEEEKRLLRNKHKELVEERLRDRRELYDMERKKRELEEARNKNLQSPERKDENGQTALHRIAAELDADFTPLEKMPLLLAERDIEFRTPRDIAKQMEHEANVTEIDKYVFSLLEKGEISVLKYLLLNSYEHFQPALDLKSETTLLPDTSSMFIDSINDTQEKISYLFTLVQDGDDEATERLLESQPQLATCKNNRGHPLLHVSILYDNISAVRKILDINQDVINMTDNLNRTALHYSFALSDMISDILLENKAMDSLQDLMNKTPADYKEDPSEIQKLKEYYIASSPTAEPEAAEPEAAEPEAEPEATDPGQNISEETINEDAAPPPGNPES